MSGTRGKTGTTRDIASIMRVSGRRVLAKTTGSEPVIILPDGSEQPVPRRGIVSILEQKRVVKAAVKLNADCLVTEIMSINPENHRAESQMILKPHITVLTNFRPDHLDVTEKDKTSLESVFLNNICKGSKVYIHSEYLSEFLADAIAKLGATLQVVNPCETTSVKKVHPASGFRIRQNTDLAFAVCHDLGATERDIEEGLASSVHDSGRSEVLCLQKGEKKVWFASTFAANDPESTGILTTRIISEAGVDFSNVAGLLALRSDRAERTKQWADYFSAGKPVPFSPLFVTGSHSRIVKGRLPNAVVIPYGSPEIITDFVMERCHDRTIVFGLANIAGTGMALTDYWRKNDIENRKLKDD